MAELNTLVEDIYDIFRSDKGPTVSKEEAEPLVDHMMSELKEVILARVYEEDRDRTPSLRMSNMGKRDRQLYYELNQDTNSVAEKLSPNTYIKFLYGDIIEELLLLFVKLAGHTVSDEQKEVEVNGVLGHMDCVIDGTPIDCKSASKFSFAKFLDGSWMNEDPFGYKGQISGYMAAENSKEGGFLVFSKETGEVCLSMVHEMELENAPDRIDHIREVVAGDTPPERCYSDSDDGAAGNRVLHRACNYCSHKFTCWSDSNSGSGLRVFDYSNGPKYFTNVAKAPRVDEIFNDATAD